tara:strand:+ start:167 stop:580 length:414 start_codon:yes stop_codon:yes gene_type:complete
MTVSISNELPDNIVRGLVAKGEGATWEECAEIAKVSRYELQQWRKHPDAENLISTAINFQLEEALGVIACSAPSLAKRLVEIGLSDGTRGYTAVSAIQSALGFLQSGVIDRENKQEIKKIRKALEQLEGEPSGIVDI